MSGPRLVAAIVGGLVAIALLVGIGITVHRGQDSSEPSRPLTDSPSSGQWAEGERTAFVESCVKSCRASPGVTAERYPICDQACTCAAEEAQKIVSGQELVELYRAVQTGKATTEQNDKLQRMKSAGVACAAKNVGAK
jgi:hypothetical protein